VAQLEAGDGVTLETPGGDATTVEPVAAE
jgi:hypothetical protein